MEGETELGEGAERTHCLAMASEVQESQAELDIHPGMNTGPKQAAEVCEARTAESSGPLSALKMPR